MSTNKIDLSNKFSEVLRKKSETELTDDELSKVTGGGALAKGCATGVHYTSATIQV